MKLYIYSIGGRGGVNSEEGETKQTASQWALLRAQQENTEASLTRLLYIIGNRRLVMVHTN